jgi:putative SOS response-associated peptidase YedK
MIPRLWGVPPPPSAGDARQGIATVRNLDSPFWIGNLRNSEFRCLVPATGFMEWGAGRDAQGRRRQCWFSCADQPLFAFAGVWKDSEVPSFALLTCEANAALRAEGRETMPVILPAEAQRIWLSGGWDRARKLVAPYSSSLMEKRG